MKPLLFCFLALAAAALGHDFPWSRTAPPDIEREALAPDSVFDETPGDWRPVLEKLFLPTARRCSTAREAVLAVASNMSNITGVYYSPERRTPCMSPLEALNEKKVSCTGQSILLVCALRSIGIPARPVGVFSWAHLRGNHTWVEAWFDNEWHMIEFNEKDFNTPWVMENIGMLSPDKKEQRIWAVSTKPTGFYFPAVWNEQLKLPAEDVTERYMNLSRTWYAKNGLSPQYQKLLINIRPRSLQKREAVLLSENGGVAATVDLPTAKEDLGKCAAMPLPRNGRYTLCIPSISYRHSLEATQQPVQILNIVSSPGAKR